MDNPRNFGGGSVAQHPDDNSLGDNSAVSGNISGNTNNNSGSYNDTGGYYSHSFALGAQEIPNSNFNRGSVTDDNIPNGYHHPPGPSPTDPNTPFFATNPSLISPITTFHPPFPHSDNIPQPTLLTPSQYSTPAGQALSANFNFPAQPNTVLANGGNPLGGTFLSDPRGSHQQLAGFTPNIHNNHNNHDPYFWLAPSSPYIFPPFPPPMTGAIGPTGVPQYQNPSQAREEDRRSLGGDDDDDYLAIFANDFSSPSIPPLDSSRAPTPTALPTSHPRGLPAVGRNMPQVSSRRGRSTTQGGTVDIYKEEPEFGAHDLRVDSSRPIPNMPATTRRQNVTANDPPDRKRRPSATPLERRRQPKSRRTDSNDDVFSFSDSDLDSLFDGDVENIDLSNVDTVPESFMAPKVDNRVKLGKFQCVICMDNTTAITVTHCGHLFCSECLHSALYIDDIKRPCPVCRTKVDPKKPKAVKSFYHLELKVMTAKKKGKQLAGG
ncbi:hypothetical protein GGS20DRAFT_445833 [Poronia punctata]|nr:hypothetical protein GGS20DRAFT_445833 [Poronia punctata]